MPVTNLLTGANQTALVEVGDAAVQQGVNILYTMLQFVVTLIESNAYLVAVVAIIFIVWGIFKYFAGGRRIGM